MDIKSGGNVSALLRDIPIPRMFPARQTFPRNAIPPERIPDVVEQQFSREPFASKIRPGMSIAITAGSRGIANVAIITKAVVDAVKRRNAYPFIVPAMGSHGGATAEGQLEVLAGYGITDAYTKTEVGNAISASEQATETKITNAQTTTLSNAKEYTDTTLANRVGAIPADTTIAAYIDTAVGAGGTASASAIATAKQEAIDTSKSYTDTQINAALTVVEF